MHVGRHPFAIRRSGSAPRLAFRPAAPLLNRSRCTAPSLCLAATRTARSRCWRPGGVSTLLLNQQSALRTLLHLPNSSCRKEIPRRAVTQPAVARPAACVCQRRHVLPSHARTSLLHALAQPSLWAGPAAGPPRRRAPARGPRPGARGAAVPAAGLGAPQHHLRLLAGGRLPPAPLLVVR
mgnify:CR=1 FL=1